ncbi:hypothetical protein GLOTRDRAFT_51573, partial [Gloeophyllum trabeum ATCC 11539]
FKRHCARLAGWNSEYMGLNQFPSLPDKFDPTPYINTTREDEKTEYYFEHCLPTTEQIVERLRKVREDHPSLSRVYLLTNGWGWWLSGLKDALREDGWADATSSLDIQLDAAQSYVGMAVDMAIAEKAEVFVGKWGESGIIFLSQHMLTLMLSQFSSLSSNVVMLRMVKGLEPASNRFL